jgi:hypothetical protein
VAKHYFSAGPVEFVYVPNLLLFLFPTLDFCCMHNDGVTNYSDQVHCKAPLADDRRVRRSALLCLTDRPEKAEVRKNTLISDRPIA